MVTRREMLAWSAGGLAVGSGLTGESARAAGGMVSLRAIGPGSLNPTGIKVLANAERIALPSYRFGIVMRSGISATAGSGTVTMEASAELTGIDRAALKAIADACLDDFATQLMATGRTIVPFAELTACSGFAKLETTPAPFIKKPFADARTVVMVSGGGLPLVNQHSDSPLTDKSPFALGNWRAINQICVDLKCVVMIPSIVIDFAALTGSGHSTYGGSASVGIQPGLFLVPLYTQLSAHYAKIAIAGPGGKIILKDRVAIGQAGRLVQTSSYNNRAEVAWWNATAALQPNNAGAPTQSYDYSTYQYQVEPAAFRQACLDAAKAMNSIYTQAAAAHRPA